MSVEVVRKQVCPIVGDGYTTRFEVSHDLGRHIMAHVVKSNGDPVGIIPTVYLNGLLIYNFGNPPNNGEILNVIVMG